MKRVKNMTRTNPEQAQWLTELADNLATELGVSPEEIGTGGDTIGDVLTVIVPAYLVDEILKKLRRD